MSSEIVTREGIAQAICKGEKLRRFVDDTMFVSIDEAADKVWEYIAPKFFGTLVEGKAQELFNVAYPGDNWDACMFKDVYYRLSKHSLGVD